MSHDAIASKPTSFDGLARVVRGPTFPAPWTELPAIVVVWRFSAGFGRVIASGALGDLLVVDTPIGRVEVPLEGTQFVLSPPSDHGELVSRPIPKVFAPILLLLARHGRSALYAREDRLVADDRVHLVADVLVPTRRDAYRSVARLGPEVAWRVDPARGRSRVVGSWLPER